MLIRLNELIGPDRRTRWKIIFVSGGIIASWGIIREALGGSVRDAQIEATMVGAIAFFAQCFAYCSKRSGIAAPLPIGAFPRRFAVAAGVLLFLSLVPAPLLNAEILRRRLKDLSLRPLSPDTLEGIKEVVDTARVQRVVLDPNVIAKVGSEIINSASSSTGDNEYAKRALDEVMNYRSFSNFNSGVFENMKIGATTGPGDGAQWLTVKHGEWLLVHDTTIVLDAEKGEVGALWVQYQQETAPNVGVEYHNIIFKDCKIEYRSRSVRLNQVIFLNCKFSIGLTTERGRRLAAAILSNKRGITCCE